MALTIVPCTFAEAREFIARHHRHHKPPPGGKFAVAVADGDKVVGVAVAGRPVARLLDDGFTLEVTRAARALGFRRVITYTLPEEGGGSLRGAGFRLIGVAGGGTWNRRGRPRADTHPLQKKLKWECETGAGSDEERQQESGTD